MKFAHALLALSLLAASVWAQDPPAPPAPAVEAPRVELPETAKGDVGSFIKVAARTNCREVRWVSLTPGLAVFPVELLKDSRTAIVSASAAGEYKLLAYGALGDVASDPAVCTVTVGNPPPLPTPVPVPAPVDAPSAELQAIVAPIKAVVAAQPDAAKRAKLAAVWGDFHSQLVPGFIPPTLDQFKAAIGHFAAANVGPAGLSGAFPGFDAALNAAFAARFGAEDGPLDATRAREFAAALVWAAK